MHENDLSYESLLESTHRAVDKFGETELEVLSRKVVYRLQRVDASGIYGDDFNYKTLWDEYCHEIQQGPCDLLDSAWNQTLESILDDVIKRVPRHMAELLSIFAQWELESRCDELNLGTVWPDGIRDVLRVRLYQSAAARNLERFMT